MENYRNINDLKTSNDKNDKVIYKLAKRNITGTEKNNFQKNPSEKTIYNQKENLFNPKEILLKEKLNEFNKKNFNQNPNNLFYNNNSLLDKSLSRLENKGNHNSIAHLDLQKNSFNPSLKFSNYDTLHPTDNYLTNNQSQKSNSRNRNNNDDDQINNFIDEAHECIKNHLTESKSNLANNLDSKSQFNNYNFTKAKTNSVSESTILNKIPSYAKFEDKSDHYSKLNNWNSKKLGNNEDGFLTKMQQDKISKKHRDIDNTLEEIKTNLNNLSQKIKSKEHEKIKYDNSSKNKVKNRITPNIDSSLEEEDYLNRKYTNKNINNNNFKNKQILKSNSKYRNLNYDNQPLLTNNSNRSYSSGDSLDVDYPIAKKLFVKNNTKSKSDFVNDIQKYNNNSKIFNTISSRDVNINPNKISQYDNKYNLTNSNSKTITLFVDKDNKFTNDSRYYDFPNRNENNLINNINSKSNLLNFSSDKNYTKSKRLISSNKDLDTENNINSHLENKNLEDNFKNSLSFLKDKNPSKYGFYNEYKNYEDYNKKEKNIENSRSLENVHVAKNMNCNTNNKYYLTKKQAKIEEKDKLEDLNFSNIIKDINPNNRLNLHKNDNNNVQLIDSNVKKKSNFNTFNFEDLKEKNLNIEKDLQAIENNYKEIKNLANKNNSFEKENDFQINDKNLNYLYRTINPEEFARVKRSPQVINRKPENFSNTNSNKKEIVNNTYQNYHSESEDEMNTKNNEKNKDDKSEMKMVFSKTGFDQVYKNKKILDPTKKNEERSKNVFSNKSDFIINNTKSKSKEKENYKFYYVKKNIDNISSKRNQNNNTNLRDKKDITKEGKIIGGRFNNKDMYYKDKSYSKISNYDNSLSKNYPDVNNNSSINPSLRNIQKEIKKVENELNNNSQDKKLDNNQTVIQTQKLIMLEKKMENYEEKILSYKNLVNQYMPEDINPNLFTIINSYLNGKDRWFLIKRNILKEICNNLYWVREAELMNLGFNINFNLFKNDTFDFCLLANNMYTLKEESKNYINEIEDLKTFLKREMEKKDIIFEDKNEEIKKLNDKHEILNEYISKLEAEKQKYDFEVLNKIEKNEGEALFKENQQLKQLIDDFKVNIKNLLEDNLKFKSLNEKLELDIKNLTDNLINTQTNENSLKKSNSIGKLPIQKKTINNNKFKNINNNNNSNKKKNLNNTTKNSVLEPNEEKPMNDFDSKRLNESERTIEIKNKLKNSIIENIINESDKYKSIKEIEDLEIQNSKFNSEISALKDILYKNKLELSAYSKNLKEVEKTNEALLKEKEILIKALESEKKNYQKIFSDKELMETQIKKIPELINEELSNFKKQKESQEKKNKQTIENLQKEKEDLESKLTEVVNIYNEIVDVNKKQENYIAELQEILNNYNEKEKNINSENNKNLEENNELLEELESYKNFISEMEENFKKEITDLQEILKIKEDNNEVLNKNKIIMEMEIQDLKATNNELNKELFELKDTAKKKHYVDENTKDNGSSSQNITVSDDKIESAIRKIENQLNSEEEESEIINNSSDNLNKHKAPKNYDIPLQTGNSVNGRNSNININSSLNTSNQKDANKKNNKSDDNIHIENSIKELNKTIEDLNKKLSSSEIVIQEKEKEILELNTYCNEIKADLENNYKSPHEIENILRNEKLKYDEELEEMKIHFNTQIENYKKTIKEIEDQANEASIKSNKEISDKVSKIKELDEKLKKLLIIEETNSSSKNKIKELENSNKDLTEKLANKESALEKSVNSNKENYEIIKKLEIELNEEKEQFNQYIKEADDQKAKIFKDQISKLEEQITEHEMLIENLIADSKSKEKYIEELEIDIKKDKDNIKRLQKKISQYEEDKLANSDSLSKIILNLENEIKDSQKKNDVADKMLLENESQISNLKKNLNKVEIEYEKKQKDLDTLMLDKELNLKEIKDLKSSLAKQEENLQKFKKYANESDTKIETLEKFLKTSNQKYEKVLEENKTYIKSLNENKQSEKSFIEKISSLEDIEKNLKLKISQMEISLDEAKKKTKEKENNIEEKSQKMQEMNDILKEEFDKLQNSLEMKNIEIEKLKDEIKENKIIIESKKENIMNIEKEYKRATEELKSEIINYSKQIENLENIRKINNEQTDEINNMKLEIHKLNEDFNLQNKENLSKISLLENEKLNLLENLKLSDKNKQLEIENLINEHENLLNKKNNETKELIEKLVNEKEIEAKLKEECFSKAQENSLRELNNKCAQLSKNLLESEKEFDEYKNIKSEKRKKLKEELSKVSLHNETLIQKSLEKDTYMNEILLELEAFKIANNKSQRESEIKGLFEEIEILKKSIVEKEEIINQITSNHQKMMKDTEEKYTKKINELNQALNNFTSQSTKEKNKFEMAVKHLDEIISKKIQEIENLNKEKVQYTIKIETLNNLIKEKEGIMLELQNEIKNLNCNKKEEQEQFLNEFQMNKVELENYKKEISDLQCRINELEKINDAEILHKKSKSDISENIISNNANLDIKKKHSQKKTCENKRYSENEDLISLEDDFKDLDLSLTSDDKEKDSNINEKEKSSNLENKEEKIKSLEIELKLKNLEIHQISENITKIIEENHKLKDKITSIESEMLESEIEKQDNEIKLENFLEEIKYLKAMNLELKSNEKNFKEDFIKEKEELNLIIDRLTTANEKYLNRINELSEEITKLNDMNIRTSHEVQNTSSVNQEEIEIELLKDELKQKDQKMMNIKEEMFNMKITIEENNTELNNKITEMKAMKKQNTDLINEISQLNQILEEKNRLIAIQEPQTKILLNDKNQNSNHFIISQVDNLEIFQSNQNKETTNTMNTAGNKDNSNFVIKTEEEIENYEEEIANYKTQIETLKEIIYQKENEAQIILKENNYIKIEIQNIKNSISIPNKNPDGSDPSKSNNVNFSSIFLSKNLEELKDDSNVLIMKEKYLKLKNTLDNYKADNNNLLQQMNHLKNEMKDTREKYEKMMTFEGKIGNFDELSELMIKLFEGFKPKNKIQEDAYKKLHDYFSIFIADKEKDKDKISVNSEDTEKKKLGFLNSIFKKKK